MAHDYPLRKRPETRPSPADSEPDFEQTLNKALELLKYRAHSRRELARKLRQRRFPQELIEQALRHCEERRYIGDASFADAYVRELVEGREYGPRMIRQKLRAKGVPEEQVEEALKEHTRELPWATRAQALLERRVSGPVTQSEAPRLIRFLLSRGFALHDIQQAMRELEKIHAPR